MAQNPSPAAPQLVPTPPRGLAVLLLLGPSIVWTAGAIGSGEVILATRTGAILGFSMIWAIFVGIFLKYWIGMSGACYTVCTGEGMIDMFARMPGPRHWAVWLVLVAQFLMAALSIGSIASAAGIFIESLLPVSANTGGWLVTVFSVLVSWWGFYDRLKIIMTVLISVVVVGVVYVTFYIFPDISAFLGGWVPQVPPVPAWAQAQGASANPWDEILPLLGWVAGGFAAQVWYTYWVLEAGYGMAHGRPNGVPADLETLRAVGPEDARRLQGWRRVVYTDATFAMIIGVVVTVCFLMAGAGVLGARQLAPTGADVALTLSEIFASQWGRIGGVLFLVGGASALIGTQISQLAGWPRLLADTFRICIPAFNRRFVWTSQYRLFLSIFFFTNMVIVYTFGFKPVELVKLSAVLDGLLLTPLQALLVGIGLYYVMPRMFTPEAWRILRPHPIFAVGLVIAFAVFTAFCVIQIPTVLK